MFFIEENTFFFRANQQLAGIRTQLYVYMLITSIVYAACYTMLDQTTLPRLGLIWIGNLILWPLTLLLPYTILLHIRQIKRSLRDTLLILYGRFVELSVVYIGFTGTLWLINNPALHSQNIYIHFTVLLFNTFLNGYSFIFTLLMSISLLERPQQTHYKQLMADTYRFLKERSYFVFRCVLNLIIWFLLIAWFAESLSITYFYGMRTLTGFRGDFEGFYAFSMMLMLFAAVPILFSVLTHLYLLQKRALLLPHTDV